MFYEHSSKTKYVTYFIVQFFEANLYTKQVSLFLFSEEIFAA